MATPTAPALDLTFASSDLHEYMATVAVRHYFRDSRNPDYSCIMVAYGERTIDLFH